MHARDLPVKLFFSDSQTSFKFLFLIRALMRSSPAGLSMQRDKLSDRSIVGSLDFRREEACRKLAAGPMIAYAFATFTFHAARIGARTVSRVYINIRAVLSQHSRHLSYTITRNKIITLPSDNMKG
jgi:hypothetical protein